MTIETPAPAARPPSDDEEAIRKLTEDWLAAVRAKDIPRLSGMVTDDAVFLPSGFPPRSWKAGGRNDVPQLLSAICFGRANRDDRGTTSRG
jgi:ketosteroid isomerase-like protein